MKILRIFSRSGWVFATAIAFLFGSAQSASAGGGGENMLLVVNPNDAASLQIANAYAALRAIPSNNILFIAPPSDCPNGGQAISQTEVTNTYLTPISNAISARGLTNQINYIGTIGQATSYSIIPEEEAPACNLNSLNYALALLTPLTNGSGLTLQNASFSYDTYVPISALYQDPASIPIGSTPAIVHSASYSVNYGTSNIATQYYMSGTIGYTGTNGNTASQVIASLRNGAASDGTRPAGAIYFEDNNDLRAESRDYEWAATESQLNARGISWICEYNTSGVTPQNRGNVLGAVCGAQTLTLPNGSTYLPGCWADNLTSYGCLFTDTSQTKATAFIAAGAAGTTGSVVEPYVPGAPFDITNTPPRFTNSSIYTFIADGSTFGEAFARSVPAPDTQMPLGDILAQPFADIPNVSITSGPGNYGCVSGTVSIGASAALTSPRIATGISTLELLVDGLVSATTAGGSGTFSLGTSGLSDGFHEVRIVAINNSQAASEGYAIQNVVVNNRGRSIHFSGGNLTLTASSATIGLSIAAGDGTLAQVELTCLGRVVAQATGSPGSLSLSPAVLAPGDNVIVPVAVYTDGMQVAGEAFTVHVESGTVNSWGNGGGNGLWSTASNWTAGALPQNNDTVARFSGSAGGGIVTLDSSANVEELSLDNSAGSYTLAASPGQTLTLSTANGAASECLINVLSGTHTIFAPLILASPGNLVNVTNSADSLTISGGISGTGSLTMTGSGTLILSGTNTYTGVTNISAGQLSVNGSIGSGSSLTVAVGASVGGTGTIVSPATICGTVSPGADGTLAFGGTLDFASASHLAWELGTNTAGGAQVTAGATTVASGAVMDLTFNGAGSTVNFLDPFWSTTRTFPVLTATALGGTFSLGGIGSDSSGTNPDWFGTFSLQYTSTASNLVWTPSAAWQDTAWQQWQVTNFGVNWNTPAIAGDTATPAHDGIPNLMKYALGANPLSASTASLSTFGVQTISGQQYLTLSFTHSLTATDVTCNVDVSGDLSGSWSQGSSYSPASGDVPTNANTTQVSRTVTGATETIVVRDNAAVSPSSPRRYMRLRVTRP